MDRLVIAILRVMSGSGVPIEVSDPLTRDTYEVVDGVIRHFTFTLFTAFGALPLSG